MQRRTLLSGVGAIGTVVLAGCSGGGGGNEGSDGNTEASGGACPSLPLSYTEKRVDISSRVAFDVPASAKLTTREGGVGATVKITSEQVFTDPQDWTLTLITGPWEGASSVEAVEAKGNLEEEVTGEYDLAVEDGRVFSHMTFTETRIVFLPTGSGPIRVRVQPSTMETESLCSDAVQEIRRRTIETVRPVE